MFENPFRKKTKKIEDGVVAPREIEARHARRTMRPEALVNHMPTDTQEEKDARAAELERIRMEQAEYQVKKVIENEEFHKKVLGIDPPEEK